MIDLKTLCDSTKDYNITLAVALHNCINQKKMAIWSREIEKAQYAKRNVNITYDDKLGFFKITSKDGSTVLSGWPKHIINKKDWFAAEDGHGGIHAIVCAPKDQHEFLQRLFADPSTVVTSTQF